MNVQTITNEIGQLALSMAPILAKNERNEALSEDETRQLTDAGLRLRTLKDDLTKAQASDSVLNDIRAANTEFNKPGRNLAQLATNGATPLGEVTSERSDQKATSYRSIGQAFVESDEFKRGMQRRGKMDGDGFQVRGLGKNLIYTDDGTPVDRRALVTSGTAPTSYLQPTYVPGIFVPDEALFNVRSALLGGTTNSDSILYMRELLYTNNAAMVAEATAVNGTGVTGGVKPESAMTFEEDTAPVRTIAHWVPVTRQTMEDTPALISYIEQRLLTGLQRVEDGQLLNGTGTAPELTGLLNTSGIQVADATSFTATPVKNAGTDNENVNRLRRALRLVRIVGRATANFIILNPADLEVLDTITDADRRYLIGGPLIPVQRTLWGTRLIESENIAAGTALVGDGSMAMVFDRMQGQIYTTDSHSDFFIRNIWVILAESRLALAVFRPKAFAKVTLV